MTLSTTLLRTLPQNPTSPPAPALQPEYRAEPPAHAREDGLDDVQKGRGRLQFCTEGLGSESSHEAEDIATMDLSYQRLELRGGEERGFGKECSGRVFPPPISCIGKSGRPCVRFERYIEDGRFVLIETWVPTHEVLRASREGGRLRLSFVQMDDDENSQDQDSDETEDENRETSKGERREA